MSFAEIYVPGKLGLSFELYPPKTASGDEALMGHVQQLLGFRPDFFTCTYGAGGSTRQKTLDIVGRVKQRHRIAGRVALDLCRFVGGSVAGVSG